ncbi:MAG: transposase, partial [Thermomicrobiales bacterium]
MPYDPERHHRRSIRLPGYDYAQPGIYFVTICVQDRSRFFGEIVQGEMVENAAARIVRDTWQDLPHRFPGVMLD